MVAEISVASAIRVISPVLKDAYTTAKNALRLQLGEWKTGGDAEKIERYHARISMVKTIWRRDQAVSIESFYYPSRIEVAVYAAGKKITKREVKETARGLKDLPQGCLVIEGIVGQGKSIFMRHLALSMLADEEAGALPIFVELRSISDKSSLEHLLLQALASLGASADSQLFNHLAIRNKLVLILDGFDEVVEKHVSDVLFSIDNLRVSFPGIQIIVSSRPQNPIQNVADFTVVKLVPLRTTDHEGFLRRLGVETERRLELLSAIANSPREIRDAISTPLMMTIVVLIYESVHQIPPYLSDFFSALFHVVFTQHDSLKQAFRRKHNTGLSEGKLQHLFEAFCFVVMQKAYGRTLTRARFDECFNVARNYVSDCDCTSDNFRADIVGVACLMLEEGVGDAAFLHKGILDYFSAAFAARLPDASSVRFYALAAREYKVWKGSLQFLEKIDSRRYLDHYFLEWVQGDVDELSEMVRGADDNEFSNYLKLIYGEAKFVRRNNELHHQIDQKGLGYVAERLEDVSDEALGVEALLDEPFAALKDRLVENFGAHVEIDEDSKSFSFGIETALRLVDLEHAREVFSEVEFDLVREIKAASVAFERHEQRVENIDLSFGDS